MQIILYIEESNILNINANEFSIVKHAFQGQSLVLLTNLKNLILEKAKTDDEFKQRHLKDRL